MVTRTAALSSFDARFVLPAAFIYHARVMTLDREFGATRSIAFRRVVYRAVARVKSLNRKTTGADVLAAMFDQTESPAAWLLSEHGMVKESVVNFISNRDRQDKE